MGLFYMCIEVIYKISENKSHNSDRIILNLCGLTIENIIRNHISVKRFAKL